MIKSFSVSITQSFDTRKSIPIYNITIFDGKLRFTIGSFPKYQMTKDYLGNYFDNWMPGDAERALVRNCMTKSSILEDVLEQFNKI